MLLFAGCLSAQDNLSALLPMPNQVKQIESKKDFIISGKTTIQTNLPNRENTNSILFQIRQFRHSPHTGSFSQRRWTLPVIRIRENSFHKRGNTGFHSVRTYDLRSDSVRRCMPDFIGKDCTNRNRRSTPFQLPFIDVRSGTSFPAYRRCEVLYRPDGTI